MTLRIRLILAFLLMSVVPLAAMTAYSYVSTRNAFRSSAEIKSNLMAEELGHRMEVVTGDIERRVGRIWRMSRPEGPVPGVPGQIQTPPPEEVTRTLGNFAGLVEKLELMPGEPGAPPMPPPPEGVAGPGPSAPPPPPPGSRPPGPGAPPGRERAKVDVRTVGDRNVVTVEVPKSAAGSDASRVNLDVQAAVIEASEALRREAGALQRQAESAAQRGADMAQRAAKPGGRDFDFRVMEDGQRVGTVHARVNLERMLRSVLMMTRRDQGEIPFAVDADGQLHTADTDAQQRLSGLDLATRARAQRTGRSTDREWVIVTREVPSGVVFGIARPIGGSMAELRRAAARNLGLGLAFITLALVGVIPLSNRMTRNLRVLTTGVERISGGDLSAHVDVRSSDEFGRLATAFNRMAADLTTNQRLAVEQERLRRELELSRQIQNEMLPRGTLRLGIAEVKGVSIPAREVGGDFFNYFPLPSGELALLVGDVSGKGISAALLMANIQATLKARLPLEANLATLADVIDRDVHENTPPEVYLTLFVGLLDPTGRRLRYVNAGHNPQFVLRAEGGIEGLYATGLPVGLLPGRGYQEATVTLGETDLLFFYTDGTVEIENEQGEFFGYERLASVISRERTAGVEAVLADVENELRAFRGAAEPSDDATMMALRLSPAAA